MTGGCRRIVLALALPAALLPACRSDEGVTVIPRSDLPASIYAPSPTPTPPATIPESGLIYLAEGGRLAPAGRHLERNASSLAEALLLTLLSVAEARTAIPPDTRLLGVGVVGGVATVDLSQEFEQGGPASTLALRVAQIVYTVTEDDSVRRVLILIEGESPPIVAGDARTIIEGGRPVGRADYTQLGPTP